MRSDEATWERLKSVLDQDDAGQTIYGYRLDQARRAIKPYLFCWYGHSGLVDSIRDAFGAGEYRLLPRKDRVMVFSGYICITSGG